MIHEIMKKALDDSFFVGAAHLLVDTTCFFVGATQLFVAATHLLVGATQLLQAVGFEPTHHR